MLLQKTNRPEERLAQMNNSFIAGIVLVDEERGPAPWQRGIAHGVPVVLTGDVAASCAFMHARLVVTSVTVPCGKQEKFKFWRKILRIVG